MMKKKNCPKCNNIKPITSFVNIYGFKNPRGKYCNDCYLENELFFVKKLMEGRDYCLYCGKKIKKVYEWTKEGKTSSHYIEEDHMDPLSLGGEDSTRNTVYCCTECNKNKTNISFLNWLQKLKPNYQKLARRIYTIKHGHAPEKFKPVNNDFVISIRYNSKTNNLIIE